MKRRLPAIVIILILACACFFVLTSVVSKDDEALTTMPTATPRFTFSPTNTDTPTSTVSPTKDLPTSTLPPTKTPPANTVLPTETSTKTPIEALTRKQPTEEHEKTNWSPSNTWEIAIACVALILLFTTTLLIILLFTRGRQIQDLEEQLRGIERQRWDLEDQLRDPERKQQHLEELLRDLEEQLQDSERQRQEHQALAKRKHLKVQKLDKNIRRLESQLAEFEENVRILEEQMETMARGEWFQSLTDVTYRNEVEVEVKLIHPLVSFLGYRENDFGLRVSVDLQMGHNSMKGEADWVLWDKNRRAAAIIEAKSPTRILDNAVQSQGRSYAFGLNAPIYMITNGKRIQIFRRGVRDDTCIVDCETSQMAENWEAIYRAIKYRETAGLSGDDSASS